MYRLFYDTIKGGDFRSREANVHRLAEVSANIIDQCAAQGVPFAREYSGYLSNRSFGGAQVSRTFYARGQAGQQLLLGAYQALMRQVGLGQVTLFPRTEMLELVVVNGHAKGVVRDMVTGKISSHSADAVVLATRRLRQRLLSFHLRSRLERHGHLAGAQEGRAVRQSVFYADSPDVHSGIRRLSVQAHVDERIVAQRWPCVGPEGRREISALPPRFPRTSATIISNGNTRATEIWRRAMFLRAKPNRCVMRDGAWVESGLGGLLGLF